MNTRTVKTALFEHRPVPGQLAAWPASCQLLLETFFYFTASSGLWVLGEQARAELYGNYISIPLGVLSYTLEGPAETPLIILVHGLSTPTFV